MESFFGLTKVHSGLISIRLHVSQGDLSQSVNVEKSKIDFRLAG
jgi:hypothetical protein